MQLDDVINSRIGLGPFQIRSFLVLCLVGMNDGVELVLSSFLNPIIKANFPGANSANISISSLASIFYLGILFGSVTSGRLADPRPQKTDQQCPDNSRACAGPNP